MDSSKRFACVLVLVISAIMEASAQSGFGFPGAGRQKLVASGRVAILETPRVPEFVAPRSTRQTCLFVKTIMRPQIRRNIFTISPVQRIIQSEPFIGGINVRFSLPGGIISRLPSPLIGAGSVNFGSVIGRPDAICAILGGQFLGNSALAAPPIVSRSLVVDRGFSGVHGYLFGGTCMAGRGIIRMHNTSC